MKDGRTDREMERQTDAVDDNTPPTSGAEGGETRVVYSE